MTLAAVESSAGPHPVGMVFTRIGPRGLPALARYLEWDTFNADGPQDGRTQKLALSSGTPVASSLALAALSGPSSLPAHADSEEACGATGPVFRPQGLLPARQRKLGHHEAVRILAIGSSSTEGAPVTVVSAGIGGGDLATRQVGANDAMAEAGRPADASAVRR